MVQSSSQARRDEIVDALFSHLATRPVNDWSVRGLALALDVSTFTLLKLFRTRRAILLAALARVRVELGAIVSEVVSLEGSVSVRLRALLGKLIDYYGVQRRGVGRLFFLLAALDEPEAQRVAAQLMSMKTSFVAVLLREAEACEGLSFLDGVTPDDASRALVGALYGSMLHDMTTGAHANSAHAMSAHDMWSIWMAGISRQPWSVALPATTSRPVSTTPVPTPVPTSASMPSSSSAPPEVCEILSFLDVRPILAAGRDPLESILAHLDRVPADGVLEIAAPFRPSPLIKLLEKRGCCVALRQATPDLFLVDAVVAGGPEIVDLSGRPAPEPMTEILRVLGTLAPSNVYLARVPQRPNLLLPRLDAAGMRYAMLESPDGTVLLRLIRPPPTPSSRPTPPSPARDQEVSSS